MRLWQKLDDGHLATLIEDGIRAAAEERTAFARWKALRVSRDGLQRWVDGPVAAAWSAMAAARVSTIARTGSDGKPGSGRRKLPPHLRPVFYAVAVPGSPAPCADSYAAAQILA